MCMFSLNTDIMVNRKEKIQYLKEKGWWAHFNNDCWFDSALDELYVENGDIKGFRPKSEGLTLEEAFGKFKNKKYE